jgi:hypothetical protein
MGNVSQLYDYRWRDLPHLIHRTVKTVAMVMMLIGFSVAFGTPGAGQWGGDSPHVDGCGGV